MKIDIIICTYNRFDTITNLVSSLLDANIENLNNIIVVDSSDVSNDKILKFEKVIYVRSSHKNQPYQRYLGFNHSKSDINIFLDDDMELISTLVFKDILQIFSDLNIVGIAINFKDKNENNLISKIPHSLNNKSQNIISRFIRFISFNPIPDVGEINLFGLRGPHPIHLNETFIVSGGAFAARKDFLFKNFNFQLFDLFQKKLGMGEDTLIGYGLSRMGRLLFYETLCFLHNDESGSNYSFDLLSYSKRVIYSRLFMALEKARLDGKLSSIIYLKYYVYVLFRVLGVVVSNIFSYRKEKTLILKGLILGFVESFNINYSFSSNRSLFWNNELMKDCQYNSNHDF